MRILIQHYIIRSDRRACMTDILNKKPILSQSRLQTANAGNSQEYQRLEELLKVMSEAVKEISKLKKDSK